MCEDCSSAADGSLKDANELHARNPNIFRQTISGFTKCSEHNGKVMGSEDLCIRLKVIA